MEVDRQSAQVWASWFRCLGDPSRVLLLNRLAVARRPMTVGELVAEGDIGQSTVSHHLKLLAETGFVLLERRGTESWYRVNERCLERFPSAAEVVMGVLPRYETQGDECTPPWQTEEISYHRGQRVGGTKGGGHGGRSGRSRSRGEGALRERSKSRR